MDAPEAMGEEGGGAGIGEGIGARGTRYRFGRICLEQTGHQEVSRWFIVSAGQGRWGARLKGRN